MWISKWYKLFTLRNSLRNEQQAGEIADRVLILCRVWTSAHLWVDGHFWLLKIQISGKNESKLGRDFKEILSFLFSLFCRVRGDEHVDTAWLRVRGSLSFVQKGLFRQLSYQKFIPSLKPFWGLCLFGGLLSEHKTSGGGNLTFTKHVSRGCIFTNTVDMLCKTALLFFPSK